MEVETRPTAQGLSHSLLRAGQGDTEPAAAWTVEAAGGPATLSAQSTGAGGGGSGSLSRRIESGPPRPRHSVPSQVIPDPGPGSRRATMGLFPTLRTSGQGATDCAFPRGRPLHTYRRARRVSEVPGSAEGGLDAPRALPALILWAQALLAEPSQCFISCQSTGNSLPPQQAWEHTTPC